MSLFLLHQQSSMWKLVSFDWLDRSLRWGLVSLRQIWHLPVRDMTCWGKQAPDVEDPRLHYSQGFRGLEQSSNGPLDSNTLQQSMKKATSKISTHKIITARFKQAPHMREPKVNERLAKDRKRWKKPLFFKWGKDENSNSSTKITYFHKHSIIQCNRSNSEDYAMPCIPTMQFGFKEMMDRRASEKAHFLKEKKRSWFWSPPSMACEVHNV